MNDDPHPPGSPAALKATAGRALWLTLLAACLGWMFDGMQMGIFPLVARPALQEMQAASGLLDENFVQLWMGRITALFLIGAAAGGIVFGWLGDRIGRVRAMTLSILCYSLFSGVGYFAVVPWHLGFTRFLAALGMGGEWALGVALVMECWPAKNRSLLGGLIGAAGNMGYALIAVVGMSAAVTRDSWRWVMLVGAAPALLALLIIWFVPESEQWRAAVGQARGRPLREVFGPVLRRRTLLAISFSSVALIVTWGIVQWIPLWADQLTHGGNPRAKATAQLVSAVGSILGCLATPLLGLRMGQRPLYFWLCLGSLISCLALFQGCAAYGTLFILAVGLVGFFTGAFYGWLPQYLPTLFPTRVRATGQGIAYNLGRLLAAAGAWKMGALMAWFDHSYPKAGTTIALVYLAGMGLIWLAPETRGKPLPE